MPKIGNKFLLIISGALIVFFIYYSPFNDKRSKNTVVATVNDKKITYAQLQEFSVNTYGSHVEEQNEESLEMMLNQEVLILYAYKSGIVEDVLEEVFEKQMRYTRERLMLEMFFDLDAQDKVTISNNEISDFYQNQPLFTLKSIPFLFSDELAKDKAEEASKELNRGIDFDIVYKMFFPAKGAEKKGLVGITNFYDLPDYLKPYNTQLISTGSATDPIETEFGYTVFYRSTKPSANETKGYIRKELLKYQTDHYITKRQNDITKSNRINLFNIDKSYQNRNHQTTNENLATNDMTNTHITEKEVFERLKDLYEYSSFAALTHKEFLDYINLFITQKAILSIAESEKQFQNAKFTANWEKERVKLLQNQNQEIANYMFEDFHDLIISHLTDNVLKAIYEQNVDV
ncbi:MAG: hypothetical protein FWG20_03835, partial [Candidatus Cloacimonetes bacterium]|nr:hypothetical protein [Candidatus Cloacimonadota bacterium]